MDGNWTYGYDDFNRLASSSQGSPATQAFTYGYDRFGNRWTQTATVGGGPQPSFSFDANNHISDGSTTYDAAGNTWTYNDGVTTHTYAYDAENRMAAADTSSYVYDAEGRRVKKVVSGAGSEFLYDLGGHAVTELTSAGAWTRGEVYAGGRQLATYRNGTTYFAHADWLGTQRLRTDVSGNPVAGESYQSLPFGDAMTPSTVGVSPDHFTGKERDTESNLDYFGARYYSSSVGRWLSPDWSATPVPVPYASLGAPQTLNLYGYRGNNPVSGTDVDGHCWPYCELVTEVSLFVARHPDIEEKVTEIPKSAHVTVSLGHQSPGPVNSSVAVSATVSSNGATVSVDQNATARVGAGIKTTSSAPIVQDSQVVNPVTNATSDKSVVVGGEVAPGVDAEAAVNSEGEGAASVTTDTPLFGSIEIGAGFGAVGQAVVEGLVSDIVDDFHALDNAIQFSQTHDNQPNQPSAVNPN